MNDKFRSKITSIEVKQGDQKVKVDPSYDKRNSLFPGEQEI